MSIQIPLPQGGTNEIIVTTVFLLLAILAVIARFYARFLQNKRTSPLVTISLSLACSAPLAISTFFIKLSILFFYISIFTMPKVRTAVSIVITLSIALIVAVLFESFLLCQPFAYTWDKTIPGGGLQMPLEKKLSISGILALGFLICALTAARINSVLALDPLDFTYTVVPNLIFGALEIELSIVNACLPILRRVVRKIFESNFGFVLDWSLKPQRIAGSPNRRKGSALIDKRNPGRIGERQMSGNIIVEEDLYIKRRLM
ncbi:hypothetical protein VMCG_10606 [Cytospora schulzeri]|uniref:Rhodopsin domain-containing protein n=1 Tax=Cytospora schulzeri TaxID=448051 RepID=A0A423V9N3_9PEZI|nr:hypothetical protein VMCG_10606 [Valsa malicola]